LHSFDKIALYPDECVKQSFKRHSNQGKEINKSIYGNRVAT